MSRGRNWSGISLIEVLVILAVLSVIVGLAIPRLDSDSFRADANVRLVRSTLSDAKKRAQETQHNVLVSFAVAEGRIRIVEDSDNNFAASRGEKVAWKGLTDGAMFFSPADTSLGDTVSPPVTGSALTIVDSMPTVIMLKDGSASSSMQLYLKVRGKRSDAVRGVSLDQRNGETRRLMYTSTGWKRG